jgi:GNAT superfamily N-acetyltransferase
VGEEKTVPDRRADAAPGAGGHTAAVLADPACRPVRDTDSAALIGLIGGCWAEYPGCVLDVDGEEPWLRAPATAYAATGGTMWVVERAPAVVACIGLVPHGPRAELKSLYVGRAGRRQGLGARLVAMVEAEAVARGARDLELWSDTRFTDAHRLYQRLGYARTGRQRDLRDLSATTEYQFHKTLPLVA